MGEYSVFSGLASLASRRARAMLLLAVALAAVAAVLGAGVGSRLNPYEATDPATQSAKATAALERATGLEAGAGLLALVRAPAGAHGAPGREGVESQVVRARARRIELLMRSDPAVGRVVSFLDGGPRRMYVSRDGAIGLVAAQFHCAPVKDRVEAARVLAARLQSIPGVTLGGPDLSLSEGDVTVQRDLKRAELIAFPILMVLLLVFFRGVVAALLPLTLGALSILLTELALRVASGVTSISIFTLSLISLLGLGLAIDYSLLIVSRFREELAVAREDVSGRLCSTSHDPFGSREESAAAEGVPRAPLTGAPGDVAVALERTMRTAGRTVCFSAMTVAAALGALLAFPQPYFFSMGLGGALVVLLTGASALLVLPALLALLGGRVNALAPAWLQARGERSARVASEGRWYRVAWIVMRRPVLVTIAASALMIALAWPFTAIRLTTSGASTLPRSLSARRANDTLMRSFPADPSRTVLILATGADGAQLAHYRSQLERLRDVGTLLAPAQIASGLSVIALTPTTSVLSSASQRLVHDIRALRTQFPAAVTGQTAAFVDLKSSLAAHLPPAIALVIAITTIALFLMTGSVVLPLKTLVMNALTVCAAYGILVLVFQDGNLRGLLGYESPGAIDIAQPVVMLAVVFGLSTDYGVFLLDRIREAHRAGLENEYAVALGLERTGRIITTAALLFCVAITSSITSEIVELKEVSFGVAAAILLDATVVRSLLVPALMRLLGDRNWWAPRPLRLLHERIAPPALPARAAIATTARSPRQAAEISDRA